MTVRNLIHPKQSQISVLKEVYSFLIKLLPFKNLLFGKDTPPCSQNWYISGTAALCDCRQVDEHWRNHSVFLLRCPGESRRQAEQYRVLCVTRFSSMLPTVSRAAAQTESIHMVLRKSHNQSICWQAGLSHVQLMNNLQRLWEGKLRSTLRLAWPFLLHRSRSLCLHVDSTDSWRVWIWEKC